MQTWQVVSRLCSRCLTVIKYSRRPSHKYGRTDRQPKAKPIRQGCVTSLQLPHHHQTVQLCRYNSWVPWQLPASAPYVRWYSVVNEASWDGDNFPFMSSWNNIDCHIILGRCVSPHDAKDNMWVQCMTPGGHSALAKHLSKLLAEIPRVNKYTTACVTSRRYVLLQYRYLMRTTAT